jgi:phosphopantetheinyl transferase
VIDCAAPATPTSGVYSERGAIYIHYADMRNVSPADVALHVTDDDYERLKAIALPGRRTEFLAGRALLRHALQHCTGRPGASHGLIAGAHGKPQCLGGPTISLTHNDQIVACAVSSVNDIGVDVQFPSPHLHTGEIARRYFSAAEIDWLHGEPDHAFYMLWVLKEAYLKALGRGLGGGLSLVDCRIKPPCITVSTAIHAGFALYSVGNGFLGVASIGRGLPPIVVECWSPSPVTAVAPPRLVATTA